MSSKGSKLYSVLHGVCPRCQEGKVFKYPSYKSLQFTEMNDRCTACGQSFEPEPDFYQGAMYVSYGLTTGMFMAVGFLMLFVFELNMWITFGTIILLSILLLPLFYRVSRLIWLSFFVRYKPLEKRR